LKQGGGVEESCWPGQKELFRIRWRGNRVGGTGGRSAKRERVDWNRKTNYWTHLNSGSGELHYSIGKKSHHDRTEERGRKVTAQ